MNLFTYADGKDVPRVRGFEVVADKFREHPYTTPALPKRKTKNSAGYDFATLDSATIAPGETVHFITDIKAYMLPDELLVLNVRSSIGFKKGLRLVNTQGWIDSDFYNNPENDGNIGIALYNPTKEAVFIDVGERIAQGIFIHFRVKDNDDFDEKVERVGGIGSTGSK